MNASTRIVYADKFDAKGYTNENSLASAYLTKPDQLTGVMTHLQGREDKKFPLTFMTEGRLAGGGSRYIEVNDVEYDWDTFNKLRKVDQVAVTANVTTNVGLNNTPFDLTFKTNWLKATYTVRSASGVMCRIVDKPVKYGNHWVYTLQKIKDDGIAVPAADLTAGAQWGMVGAAAVSESLSMGNESNVVMPGKMKNQINFLRKSYEIAGNIKNKLVEVTFNIPGKGKTRMWMDFERWQHELNWKQEVEEHSWYSEYNRDASGVISLTDPDTGLPIPYGAGVLDQIPNYDTYAELTADKIKRTVADVMYGATDTDNMNIVLYTGEGGAEEFDRAMKDEASGFSVVAGSDVGSKFVTGAPGSHELIYGAYFKQYRHVDGHTVTLKKVNIFDYGGAAEVSPKHPVSGKPLESYRMIFLDQSTYDGLPNVQMVTQRGRAHITGILKGMSPTPYDFAGNNLIATHQDKSSVHFLCSKGFCVRRNTHCFQLECDLS